MRLSIRWRLTLLNTLAVGVLLGGFAALVYGLFDRAVVGSVDTRLVECRRQLEHDPAVAADPARLRYLIEEFWEHEQVAGAVYGPGGIIVRTEELATDAVPPPPASAPDKPEFRSADLPVLGRQRVMAAPLPNATDGRTVVLATGLADVD